MNFKFGENFRFEGKFWFWVKILGSGEHFLWKVPIGLHGFMGAKFKVQTIQCGRFGEGGLDKGELFWCKVPIGSHGFMGSKYKLQSGRFYVFKFLVKILGWG